MRFNPKKTSVCEIDIGYASITILPITRNSGAIKKCCV
jgi:hypothetical protein